MCCERVEELEAENVEAAKEKEEATRRPACKNLSKLNEYAVCRTFVSNRIRAFCSHDTQNETNWEFYDSSIIIDWNHHWMKWNFSYASWEDIQINSHSIFELFVSNAWRLHILCASKIDRLPHTERMHCASATHLPECYRSADPLFSY